MISRRGTFKRDLLDLMFLLMHYEWQSPAIQDNTDETHTIHLNHVQREIIIWWHWDDLRSSKGTFLREPVKQAVRTIQVRNDKEKQQ